MSFLKQKEITVFDTDKFKEGMFVRVKYRKTNSIGEWIVYNANAIISHIDENDLALCVIDKDDRKYLYFKVCETEFKELKSMKQIKFVDVEED